MPSPTKLRGFDNPTKRTNRELKLLVGDSDGFVSFLVKDPETGKLRPYASIPTDYVRSPEKYLFNLWDLVEQDLDVDAYHSINLSYRRGHGYSRFLRNRFVDPTTQKPLHIPARKTSDLSHLGALYVDVDCYTHNLTAPYVQYKITELVDAGKLPQPSYFKDSGQGLWAFWLLNTTKAFNRTPFDQVPAYRRIQRTIVRRLKHLGADANCTDATRITRNHGSLNSKTSTRVRMHVVYVDGKIPRYNLEDLEDFFGCYPEYYLNPRDVESVQPYQPTDGKPAITNDQPRIVDASKRTGRANSRWPLDLMRFWALVEDVRGLIPPGRRHAHAFVLGAILKHLLKDQDTRAATITAAAERLYRCFQDPETHPLADVVDTITAAAEPPLDDKWPKIHHQEIADRLAITTAEAEQINEQIHRRRSKGWPPAEGEKPIARPLTRNEQRAARIALLKGWQGAKRTMSFKELAERLTNQHKLPCDASTVYRDWQRIPKVKSPVVQMTLDLDVGQAITTAAAALNPSQGTKTLTAAEVEAELRKVVGDF